MYCFKLQVQNNSLCGANGYLKDLTGCLGPILLVVIAYLCFSCYITQKTTAELPVLEILACCEYLTPNRK